MIPQQNPTDLVYQYAHKKPHFSWESKWPIHISNNDNREFANSFTIMPKLYLDTYQPTRICLVICRKYVYRGSLC